MYNRKKTILNTQTIVATVTNAQTIGEKTTTYTFSPAHRNVGTIFDLTFIGVLGKNVLVGDYILLKMPTFDIGFIPYENTITCYVKAANTGVN